MPIIIPDKSKSFRGRLDELPEMAAAWEYTAERLQRMAEAIDETLDTDRTSDFTVFLAGSYGRLEAGPVSDADLMVVYSGDPGDHEVNAVFSEVWDTLGRLNIPRSNPDGSFRSAFSLRSLIKELHKREDVDVLTRRMLLLMEARCIYNPEVADDIIKGIIDFYFQYHDEDPGKELVMLINDTIRYFRQICADYQWRFPVDKDKWALRNVKLRHSRLFIYLGLLLLAMNASSDDYALDKRDYILANLSFTPAARIARVCDDLGENDVATEALKRYDKFLSAIREPDIRESLQVEYPKRHDNDHYAEMKANTNELKACLSSMVYRQRNRGVWSDDAFEYLIM